MESYGIVIKKVKRTSDAFALGVEGFSYMLDQLSLDLAEHKKVFITFGFGWGIAISRVFQRIITEVIRVTSSDKVSSGTLASESGSILPDLTERISKLTNALVEDLGNGKVRATMLL
jgi:hypothetical protein